MSCFPCVNSRRKDVRDVDDDMAVRPADSSVSGRGNANGSGSGSDHGSGAHSLSGKGWESRGQKGNVARSFTFRELATATRNFREIVAIKQLNLNGHQGNQEFIVEVLMLSLLHHPNLVTLIGYCTDGDQRLLVYEFMSMGSLEDHLFEYAMSGKLTLKSDIYSFGVVMLELITGRKAIDSTQKPGEQNLIVWLVDPLLQGRFPLRSLHHAVAITAMCLQEHAHFRPLIGDIVVALEYLASQSLKESPRVVARSPSSSSHLQPNNGSFS
ncbi:hypothetical protein C3L33_11255, partial [Rhododendron williamsianum]